MDGGGELFVLVFAEGLECMQQEGMASRTGNKKLPNTSMKLRAGGGVRHSQNLRQGLAIKSVAFKGGNSTPVLHFATSGDAFCSQRRKGEAGT